MIKFKNNSKRLKKEFNLLDNRLRFILFAIDGYVVKSFDKDIVITQLFRTDEEQKEIYKDGRKSLHQFYLAADIRSSMFSQEEIGNIYSYLEENVYYGEEDKEVVIYHIVGKGSFHFHLQISYKDTVKLIKKKINI